MICRCSCSCIRTQFDCVEVHRMRVCVSVCSSGHAHVFSALKVNSFEMLPKKTREKIANISRFTEARPYCREEKLYVVLIICRLSSGLLMNVVSKLSTYNFGCFHSSPNERISCNVISTAPSNPKNEQLHIHFVCLWMAWVVKLSDEGIFAKNIVTIFQVRTNAPAITLFCLFQLICMTTKNAVLCVHAQRISLMFFHKPMAENIAKMLRAIWLNAVSVNCKRIDAQISKSFPNLWFDEAKGHVVTKCPNSHVTARIRKTQYLINILSLCVCFFAHATKI